jgi:predicted amidohydrolase
MELHLVQMAIARGKPALNRAKVQALTAPLQGKAGKPGLILLPELFSTGFLDEAMAAQAGPEGPTGESWRELLQKDMDFLAALARSLHCWVSGTSAERLAEDGGAPFRNAVLVYDPSGNLAAHYRKVHPFSYGGEDKLFTGGREVVTFELDGWVVQPTICYDLRFPELYRAGSSRGVHLILCQANWPEARQAHWETLLKARAIENQAFVAGVNCVGSQATLDYVGGSLVLHPKGDALTAPLKGEGLVTARIDLDGCKHWRKAFPALRDRMPADFYRD